MHSDRHLSRIEVKRRCYHVISCSKRGENQDTSETYHENGGEKVHGFLRTRARRAVEVDSGPGPGITPSRGRPEGSRMYGFIRHEPKKIEQKSHNTGGREGMERERTMLKLNLLWFGGCTAVLHVREAARYWRWSHSRCHEKRRHFLARLTFRRPSARAPAWFTGS